MSLLQLMRNWRLSPDALRALQERKLRAVVRQAHDNVPYYRSLFRQTGLHPDDIGGLEDLQRIPVTFKDELRAAGVANAVASGTNLAACQIARTSGTTGEPFLAYTSSDEARLLRQLEVRGMLLIGRRPWDRTVVLANANPAHRPWHQHLGISRTDVLTSHLSVAEQAERLRELRPDVLWAYPARLTAVLHRVGYRLSRLAHPGLLITSGEALDPWVRERLLADGGPELFNWYGCMEVGRIAFECPAHQGLHVNADHVIVECLKEGRAVPSGEVGSVVITSLDAFTMPFLRYSLGDEARLLPQPCSCGSAFPLLQLMRGRSFDMVVLPSGNLLAPMALPTRLLSLDWVQQFRIVQESRDHLSVQLATRRPLSAGAVEDARLLCQQVLKEAMQVDIEIVTAFSDSMAGLNSFVSMLGDWHEVAKAAAQEGNA